MLQERQKPEDNQNEDYFEQEVLRNPHDSFTWINFISYTYQKLGIEEARKICERALITIDISKIKERQNIWIAYMNLEYSFGKESLF